MNRKVKSLAILLCLVILSGALCACSSAVCKNCGTDVSTGLSLCKSCSALFKYNTCGSCGTENSATAAYCKSCGSALTKMEAPSFLVDGNNSDTDSSIPDFYPDFNSNSNSNSNGNSNSSSQNKGVKCQHCKGGRYTCRGCGGEGMVLSHYSYGKPMHRLCAVCHGECTVICSYCGGDGIFGN